jgi:C4-dicarboxylate-specific signal transduction histidine kinase
MGDRIQLQQVLLNLVINGIEAMHQIPEDLRYLSIAAQSRVSEGKALILIRRRTSQGFSNPSTQQKRKA